METTAAAAKKNSNTCAVPLVRTLCKNVFLYYLESGATFKLISWPSEKGLTLLNIPPPFTSSFFVNLLANSAQGKNKTVRHAEKERDNHKTTFVMRW